MGERSHWVKPMGLAEPEKSLGILYLSPNETKRSLIAETASNVGLVVKSVATNSEAADKFMPSFHCAFVFDAEQEHNLEEALDLVRALKARSGGRVFSVLVGPSFDIEDRLFAYESGFDTVLGSQLEPQEIVFKMRAIHNLQVPLVKQEKSEAEFKRSQERMASLNEKLMVASRRFEELFSGLPVACFTLDSEGMLQDWNRAAEAMFGLDAAEVLMQPAEAVFGAEYAEKWAQWRMRSLSGEIQMDQEWDITLANGENKFLVCRIIPLVDAKGIVCGVMAACQDLTLRKQHEQELARNKAELQQLNAQLHLLAITDGLTGLFNHRRFQEMAEEAAKRHQAETREMSVILMDVDKFKLYNDTFGHPAGDAVLRAVAEILSNSVSEVNCVARYGGEEFAILMPECGRDAALEQAEACRKAIEGSSWSLRQITVSVGVASGVPSGNSAHALIQAADQALYVSKANGRNQVHHFSDLPPSQDQAA